ncbi:MAG: carotenoid biosynthesis protein [Ferruginibacter sp.]
MKQFSRYQFATAIAIIFHAVGLAGILFFNKDFFIGTTAFHLLLMCALIFYTQERINFGFILFFILCFIAGMCVEIVGTSTGMLFGNYSYGNVLGPGVKNVPFIIGINWFIIVYCCGIGMSTLFRRLAAKVGEETVYQHKFLKTASVVFDGATLAVFFDWILEPAAVKLGYWQWQDGDIPGFNYLSWFMVSALLLLFFQLLPFNKHNKFAVNLLLIQLMFFLILRTFL